jgi:hypothetical protein
MSQVETNKKINGVDLLLFFQNKHLILENTIDGLNLKQSEELNNKIPNVNDIVTKFLYAVNELEYTIGDAEQDDNSGSEVQD